MTNRLKNTTINDIKSVKLGSEFFIALDSDGTIFNSMKIKHDLCYFKPLIEVFELEEIYDEVYKTWSYINLYSHSRGINRFKALIKAFDYISRMKKTMEMNIALPNMKNIKNWLDSNTIFCEKSLTDFLSEMSLKNDKKDEKKILKWSKEVDRLVDSLSFKFEIFDGVIDALKLVHKKADIMVLSNTPLHALNKNWKYKNLYKYVKIIGGQETGTKYDMLIAATENKYKKNRILVIGDSNSDYFPAKSIESNFFPIIPHKEIESWSAFINEGADKFFSDSFSNNYQSSLLEKFNSSFNKEPNWYEEII